MRQLGEKVAVGLRSLASLWEGSRFRQRLRGRIYERLAGHELSADLDGVSLHRQAGIKIQKSGKRMIRMDPDNGGSNFLGVRGKASGRQYEAFPRDPNNSS